MNNTSHPPVSLHRAPLALVACALIIPALLLSVSTIMAGRASAAEGRSIIAGHLVPALSHLAPVHTSDAQHQLQLSIALQLRNTSQLNQLLKEQDDPSSPLYHQYLTPQQFADFFGPAPATVAQVTDYLRAQGLHVSSVSPNRTMIDASGSVAVVERAFHTTLSDYRYQGRSVYAPTAEPSVPSALSGDILTIGGLDNVGQYHPRSQVKPAVGNGPAGGYTPNDLRTAYQMGSLLANDTGKGQTIALFELDGYVSSDINAFLSHYNLGTPKYSNVLVDGASNTAGSGAVEVELDMEIVSAIAPGAAQRVYIGPNSTSGVNDTYNRIVTDNVAKVTSTSWGECEADAGNSELAALDNIFKQAAAQGQAIFAASGDAGAYDCGNTSLGVDTPAGDPHVVGVGGTTLSLNSDSSYSSESAWSSSNGGSRFEEGEGGGGGYSSYFAKPAYQTGSGVTSTNARHVPDVSADADPNTGYSIYCTVTAAQCPGWGVVGGTSAATPLWASIATETNEYLIGQGKATLGSASALIYKLFNTTQPYRAYHDVTSGDNLYYNAGPGYDLASGIGSPNAWNFARDAASSTGPTTSQMLVNPGFESGSGSSWHESTANGYELVDSHHPHSGTYEAWLCGYYSCSDSIAQSVTLPGTTSKVILSYWVQTFTTYSGSGCPAHFSVQLRTSTGASIATVQTICQSKLGYTRYSFDVTSALKNYHSQKITIVFQTTSTSTNASSFYLDDVALTVTH